MKIDSQISARRSAFVLVNKIMNFTIPATQWVKRKQKTG